jgi:sulfate permease, SulP family
MLNRDIGFDQAFHGSNKQASARPALTTTSEEALLAGFSISKKEKTMAESSGPSGAIPAPAHKPWPLFRSLAGWRPNFLPADLIAGLTLAAIAIPEQMATARLGGFSPQIGFFAFMAGSLGFAVFGSNRFLSCGADSTITPIFAGGLALLAVAGSSDYQALAGALALMVGVILMAGGIFRLGGIANLLSIPVTTGFLAGISVHILVSQMPGVLGLASPDGSTLHRIFVLAQNLGHANLITIGIGFGVLAVIAASETISAQIPGALIGLVAATSAVVMAGLESKGVTVVGAIPASLPTIALPDIAFTGWLRLTSLSLLIAIVVMVQTAATTQSFPSDPGQPADVDRDFLGVGAGSILAGLFGAFPVNASPPRTGIVHETGGRSQLSGLFAGSLVLALLAFGATLLQHVPDAALGGVLLFVALRIIRFGQIALIFRQSLGEFLLIVATAATIIVLPIEQGVAIGISLSLLHGIWSTTRAQLAVYERVPDTTIWWPSSPNLKGVRNPNVIVAGLQAPLSFLNASHFRADALRLLKTSPTKPRLLVIEASGIPEIDFTAAQALLDLVGICHADGVEVAVARLESSRAQSAFARFGISDALGPDRIFHSVDQAIRSLDEASKAASIT